MRYLSDETPPVIWLMLAAIWPFANFATQNAGLLLPADLVKLILYPITLSLVGYGLIAASTRRRTKARSRLVLLAATLIVLFFNFQLVYDGWAEPLGLTDQKWVARASVIGTLLVISIGAWFLFSSSTARVLARAFFLASILVTIAGIAQVIEAKAQKNLDPDRHEPSARTVSRVEAGGSTGFTGENVYYFLLDGYAGNAALSNVVNYDNSSFTKAMEQRGFYHAGEMVSVYTTTHLTISSLFTLDYIATEEKKYHDRSAFYPNMMLPNRANPLIDILKSNGYRLITSSGHLYQLVSGGRVRQPCTGVEDLCLRFSRASSLGYLELALLEPSPLPRLSLRKARFVDSSLMQISEQLSYTQNLRPFFLWVHSLPPHSPFVFKPDCTRKAVTDTNFRGWKLQHKQDYVDGIKCVNSTMLTLVDRIVSIDPSAIIVVQGDHGSAFLIERYQLGSVPTRDWPADAIAERASALNLIRLPQRCRTWLYPAISQINTMRLVLACLEGRAPTYLPERGYVAWYESSPSFGEVVRIGRSGAQQ